jgi:hypothetical protein
MFSSANKTTKSAPAVHQKTAESTFFRKAGEETFFGAKENPAFFNKPIQAKLTVSTPDDPHEKEADAVAEKVMRMPEPATASLLPDKKEEKLERKEDRIKTKQAIPVSSTIQCKKEVKLQAKLFSTIYRKQDNLAGTKSESAGETGRGYTIHKKNISLYRSDIMRQSGRGPPTTSIPFEQTLASSKGGGSGLPGSTQNFMESRFNADFSGVRVHTGPTAISLATSVNAQAFAHGNDIYFNSGKYSPDTTDGKTLLAHELTHTIQQGASKSNPSPKLKLHRLPDSNTSSSFNATLEGKINEHKDDAILHKKEEIKHIDQKPQKLTPVQPKAEVTSSSIKNNGPLNSNHFPVSPVCETKIQAKEEEKQEQSEKNSSNQPEIQKKHEQPLLSHCDCCNSSIQVVQTKCNIKLQPKYFESSIAPKHNIENAELISTQDRGPPSVSVNNTSMIQRSVVDDALSYAGSAMDCASLSLDTAISCAKGKAQQVAMHIPGYKALRVVLGKDPITGEGVAFNGRNFIEAAFDIMPGGNLLYQKLDELHKLDAAAQWIDEKIGAVKDHVSGLLTQISNFWHSLGISDLASPLEVLKRGANIVFGFIGRVVDFAVATAKDLLKIVKDFLLDKIVDFIKTQTPAYPLLIVILGKDPITDQKVERNGINILNALLELGGEEGREQRKQMQDTGSFKKVADYIDKGIAIFSGAYEQIKGAFGNIWKAVSIESLMDPVGTFRAIYNEFAGPIKKVWDFVKETAAIILKFIKEVLFKRISAEAQKVRGYTLVTVIIGEDPFTKEVVPPTVENLIHGFMSLMDGGEEQFKQMKESGAVAKAEQKIKAAVKKLNMTPQSIIQLFIDLWNSLTLNDLAHPVDAFKRIIAKFGEPIARLIAFVVEIVKIVVEVILIIMQFPFDLINNIIGKAMQAFDKIKADPIGFLKNLFRAIKEGFVQFFGNILKHLLAGLTGWLMSELKDANVKAPKDFSLGTIIGWVLELLGISMEKIWEKLAKHPKIGPQRVAKIRGMISKLEGIWTFIKDVQERGMAAIWDKIVEKLSNLWDTVLDAIKNWIMQQIVEKMVTKLLSMLDPTGIMAVINSAIALYKAIQSFKKYVMQILQIVNSFVEGLVEIASGNTKKAADFLESTLARGVPVVIGFLANQVGLSGVGKKVGEMIEKVRDMVDKALTWLVNKAVDTGFALMDKLLGKGTVENSPEKQAKIDEGLKTLHNEQGKYLKNGKITKADAEKVATVVKVNHSVFTAFSVKDAGTKWDYVYRAEEPGAGKAEDDSSANVPLSVGQQVVVKFPKWARGTVADKAATVNNVPGTLVKITVSTGVLYIPPESVIADLKSSDPQKIKAVGALTQEVQTLLNNPLFKPGFDPSKSIPASGRSVTDIERQKIQPLGDAFGCHHGGPKSKPWYADHQPVSELLARGLVPNQPQRLYPQSSVKSSQQGNKVKEVVQIAFGE